MLRSALVTVPIVCSGDLGAQMVEHWQRKRDYQVDGVRLAGVGVFGLGCFGPVMYTWFQMLGRRFPSSTLTSALLKACATSAVVAPILNSSYFLFSAAAERTLHGMRDTLLVTVHRNPESDGRPAEEPELDSRARLRRVREDMPMVLKKNMVFWIPVNTINFWLIPLHYRVVVSATASMIWNFYLSMVGHRLQDKPPPPADLHLSGLRT